MKLDSLGEPESAEVEEHYQTCKRELMRYISRGASSSE